MPEVSNFECTVCSRNFPLSSVQFRCSCGGLLDVVHDWSLYSPKYELNAFKNVTSGVWRYKPLIYPEIAEKFIVMRGEGRTSLYEATDNVHTYAGCSDLYFKHEGENPTGSFKDRGMAVGISEAKRLGIETVFCASTGNTSASLASYASYAGLKSIVIIPEGKVAYGKLAQAMAYGAEVYTVKGTFDTSLQIVLKLSTREGWYLMNSINPWRIEGQKTIIFELLENLEWHSPDWIVTPAGNLGNTSAFGKALKEAIELELINDLPKLVAVQANGAKPFVEYWKTGVFNQEPNPQTLASAINIGNPVSYQKAFSALQYSNGLAINVSDQAILDAKAIIDSSGIGCEPASATTLAGIKKMVEDGTILPSEKIVAILTGNLLKDPQIIIDYHQNQLNNIEANFANEIQPIENLEM
ncbi:MAG: threonine synthase [Candidatus Heimdallarchaeota archaeon]|nr:MAG: threonine synthase [Candidatus Heimdallarchaeota archaeon]